MEEKTKENNKKGSEKKEPKVETMHSSKNEELEKTKIQAQTYLEMAQRITAEFDNYRKRNSDIAKLSEENGIVRAVNQILPCVDAFDNAFKMVKDEASKEGLKLIYDNLISALSSLGIEEIDALNKEFNPDFHNAVIATEDEKNSGKILEVYQKGFKMRDRVVRHSMVRVAK